MGTSKLFYILTFTKLRIAFFKAGFSIPPSALLQGRYSKIPVAEHICPYGDEDLKLFITCGVATFCVAVIKARYN